MKLTGMLTVTILAATLVGCGESAPPASTAPVESASEAMLKDDREIAVRLTAQKAAAEVAFRKEQDRAERQRFNDPFDAINRRWGAGQDDAGGTRRADMAGMIKKLEAIKAEAEALATNECTGKARATLVASMSAEIEALAIFSKEKGDPSPATRQQLEKAAALQATAEQEFATCNKAT